MVNWIQFTIRAKYRVPYGQFANWVLSSAHLPPIHRSASYIGPVNTARPTLSVHMWGEVICGGTRDAPYIVVFVSSIYLSSHIPTRMDHAGGISIVVYQQAPIRTPISQKPSSRSLGVLSFLRGLNIEQIAVLPVQEKTKAVLCEGAGHKTDSAANHAISRNAARDCPAHREVYAGPFQSSQVINVNKQPF